jgi:ribulose-phosphate 3-epimerase
MILAPSILSADFARLGESVENVLKAGADWVHFDVMDNHYVPNLTLGPMVCRALRDFGIQAPIDVHLMVSPVDSLIEQFAEAGATWISFHPEASNHVHRSLSLIKAKGCRCGLVLNPATPIALIEPVLPMLDLVLIMSVNPGFGGQSFLPEVLPKIRQVKALIDQINPNIRLEVDGGVNLKTLPQVLAAGADTIVAGSAIFGSPNVADAIKAFRTVADEAK